MANKHVISQPAQRPISHLEDRCAGTAIALLLQWPHAFRAQASSFLVEKQAACVVDIDEFSGIR